MPAQLPPRRATDSCTHVINVGNLLDGRQKVCIVATNVRCPGEEDKMAFVEETSLIDVGSGPAVVFAHGTLMDKSMFDPQIQELQDSFRVVAFDSRARSGPLDRQWKLPDLVADTNALLDALGIETCVLAGMSVGSFMALEFALAHPERLDGLIMIDGMAQAYTPEEREAFGHEFGKLDVDGPVPREFAEWAAPFCFGPSAQAETPELVSHWIDRWCDLPARSVYREAHSWLDKRDLSDHISQISVPVLIVHGLDDLPVSIDRARPMAEVIPQARMAEIPNAGHTSNLENPKAVNAAIRSFLESIYGS